MSSQQNRYIDPVSSQDQEIKIMNDDGFYSRQAPPSVANWGRADPSARLAREVDNQEYFEQEPDRTPPVGRRQQQQQQRVQAEEYSGESDGNEEQREDYGHEEERSNLELRQARRTSSSGNERREPLYFQSKIRNSGFWGKVKLRNGTWLLAAGVIQFCISIVMIGVFWRWWWGPTVNIINRVIAITLLVTGVTCMAAGAISNYLVVSDVFYKNYLGSPVRKSAWTLIASIVAIFVASILMAIYYTYWHNRWVNTPIISVSIFLYFVGTIALLASFRLNNREYLVERYVRDHKMQNANDNDDYDYGQVYPAARTPGEDIDEYNRNMDTDKLSVNGFIKNTEQATAAEANDSYSKTNAANLTSAASVQQENEQPPQKKELKRKPLLIKPRNQSTNHY